MKKPLTTVHPEQPLADEQALLDHYRQHSLAQPTPATDALILAAAAAELTRAKPAALPWAQRLHGWLFGPGHRVRWSVAFASLASIGLGLGLSLRTWQELPPAYELGEPLPAMSAAPAPASAPVVEPMAEAMELKKPAAPVRSAPLAAPPSPVVAQDKASSYGKAESAAESAQALGELKANSSAVAKQRAADASEARLANSAAKADNDAELAKAKTAPTLEQQLRALLQLQRSGATQAAAAELKRLQRLYPEHDLTAELIKLRASQP
ncbi:MAG: hypothetical protein Q8R10_03125 [Pseudomonas sp.]|uniref:hypothetical protein n=1 Tax=Pseudomonas sp. TaxID=306 RepID=UPI0027359381|nr:hypothetical protein [Pseudomonas sp.]MDP3845398.1 hypothetical protein [Pseudomonas sp.]